MYATTKYLRARHVAQHERGEATHRASAQRDLASPLTHAASWFDRFSAQPGAWPEGCALWPTLWPTEEHGASRFNKKRTSSWARGSKYRDIELAKGGSQRPQHSGSQRARCPRPLRVSKPCATRDLQDAAKSAQAELEADPLHSESIWKNAGDARGTHFSSQ